MATKKTKPTYKTGNLRIEAMTQYLESGGNKTIIEISKDCKVSRQTVTRWKKADDWDAKLSKVSHSVVTKIQDKVSEGFLPIWNGDPWWVANEVCAILGLDHVSNAVKPLDHDEKSTCNRITLGLKPGRPMIIISEPGLYRLIMKSRKPEAKLSQRWVIHEVLPTIRELGRYGVGPGLKSNPSAQCNKVKIKAHRTNNPAHSSKRPQSPKFRFSPIGLTIRHASRPSLDHGCLRRPRP